VESGRYGHSCCIGPFLYLPRRSVDHIIDHIIFINQGHRLKAPQLLPAPYHNVSDTSEIRPLLQQTIHTQATTTLPPPATAYQSPAVNPETFSRQLLESATSHIMPISNPVPPKDPQTTTEETKASRPPILLPLRFNHFKPQEDPGRRDSQ
jgi:hypothetical protein